MTGLADLMPEGWQRQQFREAIAASKQGQGWRANSEPCPGCGVGMVTEDGLLYCDQCDAYDGESDEDESEAEQ